MTANQPACKTLGAGPPAPAALALLLMAGGSRGRRSAPAAAMPSVCSETHAPAPKRVAPLVASPAPGTAPPGAPCAACGWSAALTADRKHSRKTPCLKERLLCWQTRQCGASPQQPTHTPTAPCLFGAMRSRSVCRWIQKGMLRDLQGCAIRTSHWKQEGHIMNFNRTAVHPCCNMGDCTSCHQVRRSWR